MKAILILISFWSAGIAAQTPLWDLPRTGDSIYRQYGDTSLVNVRLLVENDQSTLLELLSFLAINGDSNDREIIFNKLEDIIGYDNDVDNGIGRYLYNLFDGFYGDTGALLGMDSVAVDTSLSTNVRVMALQRLAEANHYDRLSESIGIYREAPSYGIILLRLYVHYDPDSPEIINALTDEIPSMIDLRNVMSSFALLTAMDSSAALSIAESMYPESNSGLRLYLHELIEALRLNIYGSDSGSASRAMESYLMESDSLTRLRYIPISADVIRADTSGAYFLGYRSLEYVKPYFVRFLRDTVSVDPSVSIRDAVEYTFLRTFNPEPYDSLANPSVVLDSMIATIDTLESYEWIRPSAFADSLESDLLSIQAELPNNSSPTIVSMMESFIQYLNAVYGSPQVGVAVLEREAYRFLWWMSRYFVEMVE